MLKIAKKIFPLSSYVVPSNKMCFIWQDLRTVIASGTVRFKTSRPPSAEQLNEFKSNQKTSDTMTSSTGSPLYTKTASLTIGKRGPILLADFALIDELAHFNRERIPERPVHAKGAGAFGCFEVTHDVTKYTTLSVFSQIGKRTPVGVRLSTAGGELGSADTSRGNRGFAVKFYAEDGNWDIVGNSNPIFFIRDPILFPSLIHAVKRNPVTHLKDADMFWDFLSLRPETTHQVLIIFSDRGTPDGYRHMNGYGLHTFKLVNSQGEINYCKFHFKTNQGIKNLSASQAAELCGSDPDYAIRDLYNAIAKKENPSWSLCIQVMSLQEAENLKFNPFDSTMVWPHCEFPLIPVGQLVLDRNPKNYFAEVEQIAFCPAHMIPGIKPSEDKLLQGRFFSYTDSHRHRLGVNYSQLPVNCPFRVRIANNQRDGHMSFENQDGSPNYFPNSFGGAQPSPNARQAQGKISAGDIVRHETGDDDNFSQPTIFYKTTLKEDGRKRLIENIAGSLKGAAGFIQERALKNFAKVDADFAKLIKEAISQNTKSC